MKRCDICNELTDTYTIVLDWLECKVVLCNDWMCEDIFRKEGN